MTDERERVTATMRQINDSWLAGRVDDLAPLIHEEIVMVFPGFAGRIQGREAFLEGFRDFCENAKTQDFHESDYHIDITGKTVGQFQIRNGLRAHCSTVSSDRS